MSGSGYRFGDFRLNCDAFQLLRNGSELRVERKPMELLILLVSNAGRVVTRAEIAQRLWSSEVFVDTEHGINTAIRKLRYVLREDSNQPQFIQTVTGVGYRFMGQVALAEGSSQIASASETPELSGEKTVAAARSGKPRTWLIFSTMAGVVVAILAFVIGPRPLTGRIFGRTPSSPIHSMAVLPLDNFSGNPGQEYLADGMTDELITMLAKNSTLRITSRTSVMQFKSARQPLPEIARALGVEGILEGSVSRSNGRVHLTLQLIRADDDSHIWAESYDRDAGEAVHLPAEASRAIATSLHSYVSPAAEAAKTINPAAHDAYLRGRYLWWSGQADRGFSEFKRAIEIQPDYSSGWAWLANYYGAGMSTGALNPKEVGSSELDAATKAVQLDDAEPEAHLALCAALFLSEWKMERADAECMRAIQLDPKYAEAYHFHSRILSSLGRHDEAVEAQRKATELDPTARPGAMPMALLRARRFDAAIEDARQRLEAYPNNESLLWDLFDAYRDKGMEEQAEETLERLYQRSGDEESAQTLHQLYLEGGSKAVLRWRIRELEDQARDRYISPVAIALLYAQLGDRDKTLALLEEGVRGHSPFLLTLQLDPAYDFLHKDARYRAVVEHVGLSGAN
ncbi:winged helix-turn-helix domain-containing protein [Occallatibacter savannae]|uniref:winged helix-turn-helix domain-containing protein n=1 Tax=Occallatibacter savannae TaxID=1002691 RepID=UPI000D6971C2|nr:winged helix-turn-helix domain-containing protein [Occallatibacter savannae]